jgi:RNA polymerase sigma-70 factor (sigma-E family)
MTDRDEQFRAFVVGSQRRLVNFAELVTGDHGRAEDLVQDAYIAVYAAWPRVGDGRAEAYVRRCVINGRTNWWRRRSSREEPLDPASRVDVDHAADVTADVDRRLYVLAALSRLTQRERTVVVLRHYVGLTERETAREIGIAVGTVKSAMSRAVAKLRDDQELREGATQ